MIQGKNDIRKAFIKISTIIYPVSAFKNQENGRRTIIPDFLLVIVFSKFSLEN